MTMINGLCGLIAPSQGVFKLEKAEGFRGETRT